ncbi:DNA topoisomerase IB [Pelagibacterium lentulum]|uniref:DNA topoisomerase n=1 Tax=Pelagibacterium lentulum TaxID=2029865 RepID=A0A916RNC8_9HYPH|nr:DNA topoisomerase IB [Pelagibacterium lentulum]GGA60410.1 DNA topoisomerase [Pelagibacterium lentulum]
MNAMEPFDACGLRYASDDEPGFGRRRRGKGFSYHRADGKHISQTRVISRIERLAIPPAWIDVWICADATGHIQATGRDGAGRKQYRYHAAWLEMRRANKFNQLRNFGGCLPALRDAVMSDLQSRGLNARKVVATVVWLLDNTLIRVGNEAYVRENNSFGLTTLRNRHVEITGHKLKFTFKGKSGQKWDLRLSDRRIAHTVRAIQTLPGQRLFQYRDQDDGLNQVSSQDVNAYIKQAVGEEFSSKDFRTWGGTVRAFALLGQTPVPPNMSDQKRQLNAVIDKVARELGNTRAVCRACYIHPKLIERWGSGELAADVAQLGRTRSRSGLDVEETAALRWLENQSE